MLRLQREAQVFRLKLEGKPIRTSANEKVKKAHLANMFHSFWSFVDLFLGSLIGCLTIQPWGSTLYAWRGIVIHCYLLPYCAGGKSQWSYNTAVLPKNPMFHFLFIFGSFLWFRRRVWFTVAVFGSFLISFLVHFYCQPSSVGSKNEPKMRSKMTQKRPKSATVSTPTVSTPIVTFHSYDYLIEFRCF